MAFDPSKNRCEMFILHLERRKIAIEESIYSVERVRAVPFKQKAGGEENHLSYSTFLLYC